MNILKKFLNIFEDSRVKEVHKQIKKEKKQLLKEKKYRNNIKECDFCSQKINLLTMFFCPYCKKSFCENHYLPEKHNCLNPKLPYSMKKGYGIKQPYNFYNEIYNLK